MSSEATVEELNTPATKDNPKKRNRQQRSPQTDDEEQQDGATTCTERLKHIEEKLDKVLLMLPEFEHLKARIKKLEEEKQSMTDSLEFTQNEVKELKVQLESTTASLQDANKELAKLNELERRQIKQECYNRRNNIKFYGVKDSDKESAKDTERALRRFLNKEMKRFVKKM